jgi:hypothetical protein
MTIRDRHPIEEVHRMQEESWYGFDLGHGETAVSLSGPSSRVEARNLQLVRGGAKVVPTVVATAPDGGTLVGDAALLNPKATDVRAGFKHPDVTRPDVREPVIRFVRGVLAEMASSGSRMEGRLVFGHPSGWTPAQVESYQAVLAEASGQRPLMVPEARAAFLPLKNTGELSSAEIENGRIVIVDMGSSTTDFALVHGLETPKDIGNPDGVQLGAGLLELALYRLCLDAGGAGLSAGDRARLEDFLRGHLSELVHVIVAFRKAKEDFFVRESDYRATGRGPRVDLDVLEAQLGVSWSPRINADVVDRCLDEPLERLGVTEDLFGRPVAVRRSWRAEFFRHLDYALSRFGQPPTTIVLTGGAAKMGWVYDEVRQRHPDTRVIRTAEPEHTIANGLALQGSALAKTSSIRKAIDAFVASDEVETIISSVWDESADQLVSPLVGSFVDRFVLPAVSKWRRGDLDSLNDIGAYGGTLARTWAESEEGRRALAAAGAAWYHDCVAPAVNKRVREICAQYPDIPSHAVEIPSEVLTVDLDGAGGRNSVTPELILGDIDLALNGVIVIVSSVVAMSLFGAGHAALVATGPAVVVAAAVAGIVAMVVGKDAAMKWMKGAKIPPVARKAIPESFLTKQVERKRRAIEDAVRTEMVSALKNNEVARKDVAAKVSALIDATLAKRVRDASAHLI